MSHDPAASGELPPLSGPPLIPPRLAEMPPIAGAAAPPAPTPVDTGPFIGSSLALTAIYVMALVGIQTVASLGLLLIGRPTSFGPWVMTLMMGGSVAAPLAMIPWLTRRPLRDIIQLRLQPAPAVPAIILIILGGTLLAGEIAALTEFLIPMPVFMARALDELFSVSDPVGSFLMLVVAPPLIEETLCRGLVLRAMLRRMNPATAIVASAAVFGLIHLNPWQFFYATWLGLVLGWVYYRTRSLGFCVMMHAINNGISWLMMRFDPEVEGMNRKSYLEPPEHLPPLLILAGFGFLVAGAALLLRLPSVARESGPPTSDPGSAPAGPS